MRSFLIRQCSAGHKCSIIYLIGLNLVRLGVQIALYQHGFISFAADEFARVIRAATWAAQPSINILADVQGTWLPLEKYLNGLAILIWPDVILAPRVTVFIASCLLIATLYFLAQHLFRSRTVAVLATLLISIQPWFVWLSGTPMLEMYYFALFFTGLLMLLIWLREKRRGYWLGAGICFLFATGFHVQSWTLINLVNLLTLPVLYKFFRRREYGNVFKLASFYVLGNGLIIGFGLIEYFYTGELFAFLAKHTTYSRWYYGGYDVSISEKFLYYPRLLTRNVSFAVWIGLAISLPFLVQAEERKWKLFSLLVAISSLILNSVMNIFSGPPSAAPDRYSIFHVVILTLYISYGIYSLSKLGGRSRAKFSGKLAGLTAVFLLAYLMWWGAVRFPNYPEGMSLDSVEVGRTLFTLLEKNPGVYMVELRYWDFLAVDLTSQHYSEIIFDRERNSQDRNTPSIFFQDPAQICENLMMPNLRYVLLIDEELKIRAEQVKLLRRLQTVGRWTIYEIIPQGEQPNTPCR